MLGERLPVGHVQRHVRDAFALWEQRSAIIWRVDLSVIEPAGITLRR